MKVDVARLYAFGWKVAGKVPGSVLRGAFNVVADVTWLRRTGGVVQLEKNLARARPDLDARALRRLTRAGMRSYMRYFGEAFTLGSLSRAQIDARVRGVGRGEPAAVHRRTGSRSSWRSGTWATGTSPGAWATRAIAPVTTVAERLEPEELFQEFVAFRESIGLTIFPLTGSGDVFRGLVRAARGGPGLIPLLADRDLTASRRRGRPVRPAGPVRRRARPRWRSRPAPRWSPRSSTYERLTGARRKAAGSPWGIVIDFHEPIPVPDGVPRADQVRVLTQAWVDELGRRHPAQPAGLAHAPEGVRRGPRPRALRGHAREADRSA